MSKIVTLFEGESERSIIEFLKRKGYKFGRLYKVVIHEQKSIERILNFVNKNVEVIVVMDVDTFGKAEFELNRFILNVKWLVGNSKKLKIVTQNKNLEDELVKALRFKNVIKLYELFDSKSLTEYKGKIAQIKDESIDNKLNGLDLSLFWSCKVVDIFYGYKENIKHIKTLNEI